MQSLRIFMLTGLIVGLAACGNAPEAPTATDAPESPATAPVVDSPEATAPETNALTAILAAQPEEVQARYPYRNPQATLEFFEIEPGMTVVEALPGGGWYSKLLLPYLGSEGQLVGINYAIDLWPNFAFASEEFLANIVNWPTTWPGSRRSTRR